MFVMGPLNVLKPNCKLSSPLKFENPGLCRAVTFSSNISTSMDYAEQSRQFEQAIVR
jgi:hypothetical protein